MAANTRMLKTGLVIIVLAAALAGGYVFLKPADVEPVKIGVISPETGTAAHLADVGTGLKLAASEINEWGGINGRPVRIFIEDSRTTPAGGREAFETLETNHRPDLYITVSSVVSMAVAPLAKQHQVPMVGLAVSASGFTEQNNWLFRYHISAASEAKVALSSLFKLHVKRLGILYQDDGYGRSVWKEARQQFEADGGMVRSRGYQVNGDDIGDAVKDMDMMEAVYIIGFKANLMKAIGELRNRNFSGRIAATSAVTPTPETEGVYTAAPIVYNPGYAFVDELKQKVEKQTNKRLTHYLVGGYDFLKLLAGLMEERPVNRVGIHGALLGGFVHNGLFGSFKVSQGQQDIYYPIFPARIIDGQLKFL